MKDYVMKNVNSDKWAFISYLSEPFFQQKGSQYFLKHQNRQETLIIAKVFFEAGFNVHVQRFDKPVINKFKRKYDVIFGLEPNFNKIAASNPNALKIYYATGAYWNYQNTAITDRTERLSAQCNFDFKKQRLVKAHDSPAIANYIFQIGSLNTIETYPEPLRDKIRLLRQTVTTSFPNFSIKEKIDKRKKNEYLWFGSNGTILKGLDLLLPIFKNSSDFVLNIIGNIDDDFKDYFHEDLYNSTSINYHGYLSVDSPLLYEVALRSTFVIFPSCTEGSPGTVLNMMNIGLIPLVSRVSAVDEIHNLGFIIELDTKKIKNVIENCNSLSEEEINLLSNKNINYVKHNYNLQNFENDLSYALKQSLNLE